MPVSGAVFGLLDEEKNLNQAVTSYTYDSWGRIYKVWLPGESRANGNDATQIWNTIWYGGNTAPFGVQEMQRDDAAGGSATAHYRSAWTYYDGFGQVIETQTEGPTAGTAAIVASDYDQLGHPSRQTLPYIFASGGPGTYRLPDWTKPFEKSVYDSLGRVTQSIHTNQISVSSTYDGRKIIALDENNHKKVYENDGLGRLIKVEEYTGNGSVAPYALYATTQYWYDVRDHLTRVKDAQNNVTWIGYDTLGRKTSMADPDLGHWDYRYDPSGNLTKQIDARGQATCLYYDGLNRLTGKSYHSHVLNLDSLVCPGRRNVGYTYDQGSNGLGRQATMTNTETSISWQYDPRGRVVTETRNNGGIYTTNYAYRADDQVRQITYPDTGETVQQIYDGLGRLQSVTGAAAYATELQYNVRGQLELVKLGNTTQTDYVYDLAGKPNDFRLWQIRSGTAGTPASLQDIAFEYDPASNVSSITDAKDESSLGLLYDDLNRLQRATRTVGQTQTIDNYGYDLIGNLTSKEGTTYTYNPSGAGGQRLVHPGQPHVMYLALVREGGPSTLPWPTYSQPHLVRSGSGTSTFAADYDAVGNMVSRAEGAATYQQEWDAENRLVVVTNTSTMPPQVTRYTYYADGALAKKQDPSATTVYVGQYYEKNLTTGITTTYYYAGQARIAMRQTNNRPAWLYSDQLNSATVAANGTGAEVTGSRASYLPYGQTREGGTTLPTDRLFTGQLLDSSSGLYVMGARMYDPVIGRFLSADTLIPDPTDPQALNRYSYSYNNPLGWSDPSGHMPVAFSPGEGYNPNQAPDCLNWFSCTNPVDRDRNQKVATDVLGAVNDIGGSILLTPAYPLIFKLVTGGIDNRGANAIDVAAAVLPFLPSVARIGAIEKELTSVFWSGPGAQQAAEVWAKANGGITLEMSSLGREAEQAAAGLPWEEARLLLERASRQFAEAAAGEVHVFQGAAVRVESIWAKIEYQVLRTRPDVRIIYHVVLEDGSIVDIP